MNKLVGREAFIDSVRVESVGLKDKLYVGKDLP